jgi:hypothetical protein
MYNSPSDPPGDIGHNAWSVLSSTEKWISSTLQTANTGAPGANNPYARKEVTYVCENQSSGSMIVAGIFRRLKDAREMGETHGDAEMERAETLGVFVLCYLVVCVVLWSNIVLIFLFCYSILTFTFRRFLQTFDTTSNSSCRHPIQSTLYEKLSRVRRTHRNAQPGAP